MYNIPNSAPDDGDTRHHIQYSDTPDFNRHRLTAMLYTKLQLCNSKYQPNN